MAKAVIVIPSSASGTNVVTHTVSTDNYEAVKVCFGDESTATPVTELVGARLPVSAEFGDRAVDDFGQLIVGEPFTLFHGKLLFGKEALHWDESTTDSSGNATSTWAVPKVQMHCETNDDIIRQTFRRIPYIPGKSHRVKLTGILSTASGSGITNEIGLYDGTNGCYFEQQDTLVNVVVCNSGSKTRVAQTAWNADNLDGGDDAANPSGFTADFTKEQIFVIGLQWLGVGTVSFGVVIDKVLTWVHHTHHANTTTAPYMEYPNLPVRFRCSTTSTTTEMQQVCSTVESIGGTGELNQAHYISTAGTHIDAPTADTLYALVGVKLKAAYTEASARVIRSSVVAETNDDYEWVLLIDPTVASVFTYSDVTNTSVQRALGATANTVTGGTPIAGGWASVSDDSGQLINNALSFLGTAIDGTQRELVLCVRPGGAGTVNGDFNASLLVSEEL